MFGFLNCRNVLIHPILDLPLLHISEKLSHSESAVIEAKKSGIHDYYKVVLHDTFLPR